MPEKANNKQVSILNFFKKNGEACITKTHKMEQILLDATPTKKRNKKRQNVAVDEKQLIMDAGQKSFTSIHCPKCGLMYMNGVDDDSHRRFCKQAQILTYRPFKKERILLEIDNEKEESEKIVMIDHNHGNKQLLQKTEQVRQFVDAQLGYPTCHQSQHSCTTFLYIIESQIVGCVIAHPIDKAFRILVSDMNSNGQLSLSETAEPAACGISRMWVHASHQRRRIASKLIDNCREHLIFGYKVPLERVAFSHPTPLGILFAKMYTGQRNFLVFSGHGQ